GCVSIFVSTGSTRASSRELDAQSAPADAAATTTATARRLVANGESILANVGRAKERVGSWIDHHGLAAAHQRPVHDAGRQQDPLVAAGDESGSHRRRDDRKH